MNPTVNAIVARLPKKEIVTPQEISDAFALESTRPVLDAISCGEIAAAKVGNRYFVSRAEAVRFVVSKAVVPDEAPLPKNPSPKH